MSAVDVCESAMAKIYHLKAAESAQNPHEVSSI